MEQWHHHTPAALTPEKQFLVTVVQDARWTPAPVCGEEKNLLPLLGFEATIPMLLSPYPYVHSLSYREWPRRDQILVNGVCLHCAFFILWMDKHLRLEIFLCEIGMKCFPKHAVLSKQWLCYLSRFQILRAVAYPGISFAGGSTNPAEDRGQRERGSGGGGPLVRGSGGSCNLVQEISFHIVNFS